MAYHGGNKHTSIIEGQIVNFDSNLEEKVLRHLIDNGFRDRWRKPDKGISHRGFNYTPDLELSILFGNMNHRAIVEIKPDLEFFNDYISRRMRRAADFYASEMLLLYTDRDKIWRRIDYRTGQLTEFGFPAPGFLTIDKLLSPMSTKSKSVYDHQYVKRFNVAGFVYSVVKLLWEPPYKTHGKKSLRRRKR
ncbi:hypothetical protein FWG95_01660 [Candidatus Saccharibacteria bacterium]|nr:hypothetical protein [Candidatus Saccharibacteria bacterium]